MIFGWTSTGKHIAVVFTFEDDPDLIIVAVTPTRSRNMERETKTMATQQTRKPRGAELTHEEARVGAIRARRTPEARNEEARVRETLEREYRETETLKGTGDATTMGDLVGSVASSCRCTASGNAWGSPSPTWPSAGSTRGP